MGYYAEGVDLIVSGGISKGYRNELGMIQTHMYLQFKIMETAPVLVI